MLSNVVFFHTLLLISDIGQIKFAVDRRASEAEFVKALTNFNELNALKEKRSKNSKAIGADQ